MPKMSTFSELALTTPTLKGLAEAGFERMTKIQRAAIPPALAGCDIMGAAKTGSGKTLAFLVPLLEALHRFKWGAKGDGLGALMLAPTRELAAQLFDVFCAVGKHHALGAGLVVGGTRGVRREMRQITSMHAIVSTPGRLLQHLEQTPFFDLCNLKVLVLDEADRILDLGFQEELAAVLGYLPTITRPPPHGGRRPASHHQTLFFTATQTRAVVALARNALRASARYISLDYRHGQSRAATPKSLQQHYVVCPLESKLDMLFSFVRSHLKSKVIVFLSSCKQVIFVHEALRRLRPGVPLLAMHGKAGQKRRMLNYYKFVAGAEMVLFATDVAARGLDFPAVGWVVQMDCPESTDAYIHRVGRTARFTAGGRALLMLLPSEEHAMVPLLRDAHVPIKKITVNPSRAQSIRSKMHAEIARDNALKVMAQKALRSYVRSVHLQTDKSIFDVRTLPLAAFADSLGLQNVPRIRLLGNQGGEDGRHSLRKRKNKSKRLLALAQIAQHGGKRVASDATLRDCAANSADGAARALLPGGPKRARKPREQRLLSRKAIVNADLCSRFPQGARGQNGDDGGPVSHTSKPLQLVVKKNRGVAGNDRRTRCVPTTNVGSAGTCPILSKWKIRGEETFQSMAANSSELQSRSGQRSRNTYLATVASHIS